MFSYTFGLFFLGIVIYGLKWLFNPYFNWRKQKRIASSKQDDMIVIDKGSEFKFKDYQNKSKDISISIVIPAYNEEQRLGKTLQETIKHFGKYKYEIIVVNDASRDNTVGIAKKYANEHLKIVSYTVNKGKGGAVRIGMLVANGETKLMMDADLATELNEYEKLQTELDKINLNGLGLVAGSRNHLVQEVVVNRKWYRNILMHCSNFVTSQICGVKLKDTQCGFKLFTKNTADILFRVLHLERWAFDVELFMIAKHYQVPVVERAVNWHDVEGSHLNVVEASITMARDFLLVRVLYLLKIWKFNDSLYK